MSVATLQIELPGGVGTAGPLVPSALVPLAYALAETILGRPLLPGDESPCCPGDLLAAHPLEAVLWCPCCGYHHRAQQLEAAV